VRTYILNVGDEDVDYVEGILNGIRNSCRSDLSVLETKPMPRVRRKKKEPASVQPEQPAPAE
jgi:hypothetical protein